MSLDPVPHDERVVDPQPLAYLLCTATTEANTLDGVVEHLTAHRHACEDAATVVELHAIADDVAQAWAYLTRATTALRDLVAVQP